MANRMIAGLDAPIEIGNVIGNQINPATDESVVALGTNANAFAGLAIPKADSVYATYPSATEEVYTFKLLGVTVAVVTVTFTDATKTVLSSAVVT